jgi:response regulator NasT
MTTTSTASSSPNVSIEPANLSSAGASPCTEAELSAASKAGRILLADDEHLAALAVKQCLRELGYTTIGPAQDGEHAIELAYGAHPDLALLDVRMADEFDGIDAAGFLFEELRIPTVIISAYSDARQVAESTVPGVFGYVVKPVTCEQLRAAIEVAWARTRECRAQESEILRLRNALEDRKTIERAIRMLVEQLEIDDGEALRYMRNLAKDTRVSLVEVARLVVTP